MTGMGWSEARLLEWLARRPAPRALFGSRGHDAAVLRRIEGAPVLCCDQVVEGVHAEVGTAGRLLGRKAAGRALSDLAATAARPVALVLAVAAPREERDARLRAVIAGVDAKAREHGAELVGGDLSTTRGPLTLAVSAFGEWCGPGRPPGRDRARPGELVLVTGALGGSRRGRHLEPRPRFAEAQWLVAAGARALMDVSDGLALDLARLARASRVRIDLERVPVHADARRLARGVDARARRGALDDGEDHELLATLSPARWRRLAREAARRFPHLSVIGRVRSGSGLWLAEVDGGALVPWAGRGGWLHGARG
jgi:thiamine-monophosphate kinase